MKKTLKLASLVLLACSLMFTACNSGSSGNVHVHAFDTWVTVTEATCTTDGEEASYCSCGAKKTAPISASHSWVDATCTDAQYCSKCNATQGSALGHTQQFGCERCGYSFPASLTCSNALSEIFGKYDKVQITERSFSQGPNCLEMNMTIKVLSGSDTWVLDYVITDPNGIAICSSPIYRRTIAPGMVFTETIQLYFPTVEGEYTITFYD